MHICFKLWMHKKSWMTYNRLFLEKQNSDSSHIRFSHSQRHATKHIYYLKLIYIAIYNIIASNER